MNHKVVIGLCISLFFLSGCWDRKDLNERALWVATGLDKADNGQIEISAQIVIPSQIQTQGGGGNAAGGKFFVISAKGKDIGAALQNLQTKISRLPNFGHRRVIFFGEELAKQGLKKEIDNISRTPFHSLRGDVYVVKGGTAKRILTQENPIENSPAIGVLKEARPSGRRGNTTYLNFLIAGNREGIRPSIPTIEIAESIKLGFCKFGKEL